MKKLLAGLFALGAAGLASAQVSFGVGARGAFGFGLGSSTNAYDSFYSSFYDAFNDEYDLSGKSALDWDPEYDTDFNVKPFESILAGGSLVGRIAFDDVPGLFLQPEIGFSHNQVKYTYDWEWDETSGSKRKDEYEKEGSGTFSYNSIDIPIIVGYEVDLGSGMVVSPYAGLNLSIPVGKVSWKRDAETYTRWSYYDGKLNENYPKTSKGESSSLESTIKNGVIPGLVLGADFGYKFDKHSMVMGGLRYLLDFTAVKGESSHKDVVKASDGTWDNDDKDFDFSFDALTRRGLSVGVSYVYFF